MSSLSLVTAATTEVVTVDDVLQHTRIDIDADNALLKVYIAAAVKEAEKISRRCLRSETWRLALDAWNDGPWAYNDPIGRPIIQIPKSPLQSVTSITYVDSAGNTQTLATNQYSVDTYAEPGRITPAYGCVWPIHRYQINAIAIQFLAGFASLADERLAPIKLGIYQTVAHWYEHREAVSDNNFAMTVVPMSARDLFLGERIGSYP